MRLAAVILSLRIVAPATAWAASPPVAPEKPVVTDYYGTKITDPYRWMETRGEDFNAWVKGQDEVTRAELKALPAEAALVKEVSAVSGDAIYTGSGQIAGDSFFYLKRPVGANQPRLYMRRGLHGAERRLIDPEALIKGAETVTISSYAASPDGRLVAYTLSSGGSEEAVLHVLDVTTGRVLPEAIDRARFAHPSWTSDGRAFFYNRLQPFAAGQPQAERFLHEKVYLHRVGEDPARDRAMLSEASLGGVYPTASAIPSITTDPTSTYAVAVIADGVSFGNSIYSAPLASVLAGNATWTPIATSDKGANVAGLLGDRLFLTTYDGAPRFKVVSLDLAHPDWGRAKLMVPEQDQVLELASVASDGVYAIHGDGATYRLTRWPVAGGGAGVSAVLPYDGDLYDLTTDSRRPGALATMDSWMRPIQWFAWTRSSAKLENLGVTPPFPINLSRYVTTTLTATAKDGVKIPISVVYAKVRKPGGPALVDAYGAYGISSDPVFNPRLIPWLDRGGLFAEVMVRGGGEFGETWHQAGRLNNKPNTWRDFIAGVEALEAAGLTAPGKVAGEGTSAGGIMIGRTVTERPDLLRVALMNVPISDVLRFETSEGGPANTIEFGTTTKSDDFPAMLMMSPYEHIQPGVRYPDILISGGMNDHRVPIWQPGKLLARFQADTSGGPVRFRVNFAGGHGIGSSRADLDQEIADRYAFVLRALSQEGLSR